MCVYIERMSQHNLKDIFEFEQENRDFFERILPPRPAAYFQYDTFCESMAFILSEQDSGLCHMAIIRNASGKMVGRINLSSIKKGQKVIAELGYRIAEKEQGKGYASEAVRIMLDEVVDLYGLDEVEAGTATTNMGSQKVLLKNGFVELRRVNRVMKVQGAWVDGLLFKKTTRNANK